MSTKTLTRNLRVTRLKTDAYQLTPANVVNIKMALKLGLATQTQLAAEFGVTPQNISLIATGKIWRSV